MRRLYVINILLIVVLFYAGIHLNEEEKAYLAGLRPDGDTYDWASTAYSIFAIVCTLFSSYVALRTLSDMRWGGGLLFLLSALGLLYAIITLLSPSIYKMEDVLQIFGPYIVLGMWVNAYIFLVADFTPSVSKKERHEKSL